MKIKITIEHEDHIVEWEAEDVKYAECNHNLIKLLYSYDVVKIEKPKEETIGIP